MVDARPVEELPGRGSPCPRSRSGAAAPAARSRPWAGAGSPPRAAATAGPPARGTRARARVLVRGRVRRFIARRGGLVPVPADGARPGAARDAGVAADDGRGALRGVVVVRRLPADAPLPADVRHRGVGRRLHDARCCVALASRAAPLFCTASWGDTLG